MMSDDEVKSLEKWFNEQADWFVYGTNLLLGKHVLSENDVDELAEICLGYKTVAKNSVSISSLLKSSYNHSLRLKSIEKVSNVYGLAPRKGLDFSEKNLTIVYGQNGSGKSSYVRLLKNICGSRTKETVIGNVYKSDADKNESCAIATYDFDGVAKTFEWKKDLNSEDLKYVDIFDTKYGDVFIKNASEISYEPPVLGFFSELTEMVQRVAANIDEKKNKIVGTLLLAPMWLENSDLNTWYRSIGAQTADCEINEKCSFSKEDDDLLKEYNHRLDVLKTGGEIEKLRKKCFRFNGFRSLLEKLASSLNTAKFEKIENLKSVIKKKEEIAFVVAQSVMKNAELGGVGGEEWKFLWNAAKKYSEKIAYANQSFPFLKSGARCVLCHQLLDDVSIQRMQSFGEYISGSAENEVAFAKQNYENELKNLPEIPSKDSLEVEFEAAGLEDEKIMNEFYNVIEKFQLLKKQIIDGEKNISTVDINDLLEFLEAKEKNLIDQIELLKKDAVEENKKELENAVRELEMKQFLHEHIDEIRKNVKASRLRSSYDKVIKSLNTRSVSTKKAELSEKLITENFAKRFEHELNEMRANIAVSFVKESVNKGVIKHSIVLKKKAYNVSPIDVLSEGERRIVSIAAFFADVLEREGCIPFVFDDPISSLDVDFEECVERRLLSLAESRQIIVFTHRLSFMCGLLDLAKSQKVDVHEICIKKEFWGAGEPSSIPINVDKPDKTLSRMINDEIPKIKRVLEEEGFDNYYYRAKALASDFRILVERVVEFILMGDVVQRFRRAVNTMGKLNTLVKISSEDCAIIDKMMTKYSAYEHSQSNETPIKLPEPDEFKNDMTELNSWIKEFTKRT